MTLSLVTWTITTTHLTWMTPSLQSQGCVWVLLYPHHLPPLPGHFPPACKTIGAKNIKKQKRQHDRYDRTQVSVSPPGFATLLFLFCWFPVFFWDWMGRKRRDAVQQAEFLYTGIISFKTAVLPSKSSIISKKCSRFHLHNARFISERSILFEGHQLLLQKVQYFLKRRRILSIYAVFLKKMQYSLKGAVILKMFCRPFNVQYCHKRYSSFQRTAYIVWLAMFHVQNALASHSVAFLLKQQH